jgi:uncharacterized protein YoxC
MTFLGIIGISAMLIFVAAAAIDVHLSKRIDGLETRLDGVDREMELLLDNISDLTINATRSRERVDLLEDKLLELSGHVGDLDKKTDEIDKRNIDAEEAAKEIIRHAEEAAKEVEKQWSDGLQGMLGWNPYGGNDMAGGA